MRHSYLVLLVLLGLAGQRAQGQATAWRPFRPGFIYGFAQAGSPGPGLSVHTLRVDSAYATAGGDSVYAFNRLLRHPPASAYGYVKSRNNLFGARLRWQPGSSSYYFETNAESAWGTPATATTLLLRPRAAVGSTWAASAQPALTTTLSSRLLSTVGTRSDSIATIVLSNGQQFVFSRQYGLLQGPQWLALSSGSSPAPTSWQAWDVPRAGLGNYDPRVLFALNAGDELGYHWEISAFFYTPILCQEGYRLRRILARQQTADSLIFTYQQQDLTTNYTVPSCSPTPAGTALESVQRGRWAFSLRTGASSQFNYLPLLTGEYKSSAPFSAYGGLLMGQGYSVASGTGACLDNVQALSFQNVYFSTASTLYQPGIDALGISQSFSASLGLGPMQDATREYGALVYYRRGSVVCGKASNFSALLPTRAAQAAALATLHPNPAAEAATLTFAAPGQVAATLTLRDALGRLVWQGPVAAHQASATIPLAGRPAGTYFVQLQANDGSPTATWKLTHD